MLTERDKDNHKMSFFVQIGAGLSIVLIIFLITKFKKPKQKMGTEGKYIGSLDADQKNNIQLILKALRDNGMNNKYIQAAVLAIISKESEFKPSRENMNYSSSAMMRVWPSKFPTKDDTLTYVKQPEKLANYVYGGKYGNSAPDDGWLYRGGGFNQLTFKGNYKVFSIAAGTDLVANPDKINDPNIAAKVAVHFFRLGLEKLFPKTDLSTVSDTDSAVKMVYDTNAGKVGRWENDTTGGFKKAQSRVEEFYNYL